MRIIFMGSGDFGVPSLEKLIKSHNICHVFTQPAKPAGRGRHLMPTPIAAFAAEHKIDYTEAESVNTPEIVEKVRSLKPQLIIVIAFGQKIGPDLLTIPGCRVVNIHSSLLPKYRGAAPINHAIINGENETGITIFELNEQWDAGDMLGQSKTPICPSETAGQLHDRLALMGPDLVDEVVNKIKTKTDKPLLQDHSQACKAPKLQKSDGLVNWDRPARKVIDHIRGMIPWPGSFCFFAHKGKEPLRLNILAAEITDLPADGFEPGSFTDTLNVACHDFQIKLIKVKPANHRGMCFKDFTNGHQISPGDKLFSQF
ncbi:MAG: methionyl-tRNA formyltransferase [Phycisphaerae bacterium]|nr:methionyl-tRNA formyltransferase [Phycisphaerae bacterium]